MLFFRWQSILCECAWKSTDTFAPEWRLNVNNCFRNVAYDYLFLSNTLIALFQIGNDARPRIIDCYSRGSRIDPHKSTYSLNTQSIQIPCCLYSSFVCIYQRKRANKIYIHKTYIVYVTRHVAMFRGKQVWIAEATKTKRESSFSCVCVCVRWPKWNACYAKLGHAHTATLKRTDSYNKHVKYSAEKEDQFIRPREPDNW